MRPADRLGINLRTLRASSTPLPRIWSTTSRTFRGETRTNFVIARASIIAELTFRTFASCHLNPILMIRLPFRRRWSRSRSGSWRSCRRTWGGARRHRFFRLSLAISRVGIECPRRSEFPELVPDHIFRDEYRNKLSSVVHSDRMTDHLGCNRRAPGPRAYHLSLPGLVHSNNFLG